MHLYNQAVDIPFFKQGFFLLLNSVEYIQSTTEIR